MINRELISPKSIVVVGGSRDVTKIGGRLLRNILDNNFEGEICALNPKEDEVQGVKCYRNASDVPEVELALICVAAKFVKSTVEILANTKKTKAFVIMSAGFSEMGEEGKKLQDEILDIINKNDGALIGPNCTGVLTPAYSGIFAGPIPKLDSKGVDFVSGSGATAAFIVENGIPMGLSFSSIITVGNSAQIGVEDVVKYWDETYDENSSSIKIIYIESINKPNQLLKHASSLIRKGCKIAAIKSGSSAAGSRAASSHTGALASPDLAVDILFKKAGIVRCHGRAELITTAAIFTQPAMQGKNFAIITHAGGPGVMLTDSLSKGGLEVPKLSGKNADELLELLYPGSSVANPIDFLATGSAEQLGQIIDSINDKFDNIGGMAVIFGSPGLFDISPVYKVLSDKMKTSKKPIFPILPSTTSAAKEVDYFKSLGNISFADEVSFGGNLINVQNTPFPESAVKLPSIDTAAVRKIIESSEDGYIAPEKIQELLDIAGIDRAGEAVCENRNVIADEAEKLGFPLVMKVVGPVHKSDVGGVVLNVKTKEQVLQEFDRMMQIKDTTAILMQPMLSGTELFVGAKYEDKFGHMVLCGLGGIFIEVFKDTAAALSPVSYEKAHEMIKSLKSYKIIQGIRGQEGIDQDKFVDVIVRLSALLEAAPEIKELDLNPLLGSADRVVAVDARIRIKKMS